MANGVDPPWRRNTDELRAQLYEFVKDSSEKNRHYFIGWVLFAVYVLVTVAGTTDVQLLVPETGISLPVLGIQMPLFSFYLAIPILILAIHFNLLQNLDNHALKLNQWQEAWDGAPPAAAVHAFLFDYAALGRDRPFAPLVRVANDILCYWLGPLLLATILIRFSDYQSPLYTTFHFAIFALDTALVVFAFRARPTFGRRPPRWRRVLRASIFAAAATAVAALTALPLFLIWSLYFGHPTADLVMSRLFTWWQRPEFFGELLVPRIFVDPHAMIASVDGQIELRAKVDGKPVDAWWHEQGRGLSLVGRNLNYASLAGTNLRKADFSNARMRRTDLSGAALQQARFAGVNLEGADLASAKLQAANFYEANLHRAMLEDTRLDGAIFRRADLSAAGLGKANLSGADLASANMRGAWLWETILHGVDMSDSQLEGAYFTRAEMQGVTLSSASLQGAFFEQTLLDDVSLNHAQVDGAVLIDVGLWSEPSWKGSPLVHTFVTRFESAYWEAILRQGRSDPVRSDRQSDHSQADTQVGLPMTKVAPQDIPLDRGVTEARKLAAHLCKKENRRMAAIQRILSWWPSSSWITPNSDDEDYQRPWFFKQEFLVELMQQRGCEEDRWRICSAALLELRDPGVFLVAPTCRQERDLDPYFELRGIKVKGP